MRINDALRRRVRVEVEGRENVEPTGGVIDTQSAKSSIAGGPERGFDVGAASWQERGSMTAA